MPESLGQFLRVKREPGVGSYSDQLVQPLLGVTLKKRTLNPGVVA